MLIPCRNPRVVDDFWPDDGGAVLIDDGEPVVILRLSND